MPSTHHTSALEDVLGSDKACPGLKIGPTLGICGKITSPASSLPGGPVEGMWSHLLRTWFGNPWAACLLLSRFRDWGEEGEVSPRWGTTL